MMRVGTQRSRSKPASPTTVGFSIDSLSGDVAEPVRAGMRARATADLCEAFKVPAVLLDADGVVLHATSLVGCALAGIASVCCGQYPAGISPQVEQQLTALRRSALSGTGFDGIAARVVVGSTAVSLTMIRYSDETPCQRLRLLLIVGEHSPLVLSTVASADRFLHS